MPDGAQEAQRQDHGIQGMGLCVGKNKSRAASEAARLSFEIQIALLHQAPTAKRDDDQEAQREEHPSRRLGDSGSEDTR